jgi:hypothetical protein
MAPFAWLAEPAILSLSIFSPEVWGGCAGKRIQNNGLNRLGFP